MARNKGLLETFLRAISLSWQYTKLALETFLYVSLTLKIRFQVRALPMPACRYMEENSLSGHQDIGKGVAPEVNLSEYVTCTPLRSAIKAAHSGFETQRRRH